MGPTRNLQGSYKFMSLAIGKKIERHEFMEIPMTEAVLKQINKWAMKDHAQNGLMFKNRNREEYEFIDDKEDTPIAHPENAPFPDIPAEAPGILTEREETQGVNAIQEEPAQSNEEQALLAAEHSGLELGAVDIPKQSEVIKLLDDDDENALNNFTQDNVAIKIEKMQDDDTRKVVEDKAKTKEPEQPFEQSSGMIRKSSRERVPTKRYDDYELYVTVAEEEEFLLATNGDETDDEDDGGVFNEGNHAEMDDEALSALAHYIMVHCAEKEMLKKRKRKYKPKAGQYLLDAGLKKFGSKGETAITKELRQFNTYEVFELLEASTLDEEEKKGALSLLIFLKEKWNGDVKAQSCANGSVQRNHVAKEEVALLTVCLESVFATAAIDAKEYREVVTINIPGAFLHATNEDYMVMRMNGNLAKLMAKTDPKLY
jgi:hypothetical protein